VLGEYTDFSPAEHPRHRPAQAGLVGLKGFEDYYPAEISGGMCKRAGLARAWRAIPTLLFFDEPSAGLDPISARNLDELILQLRDSLGDVCRGLARTVQHLHHRGQLRLS
jgi:phospholipid/cholesterol/gamma-HCH transport system ATP-binding protein